MIEIKELKESYKGRGVVYKSDSHIGEKECGVITSWNENYIFVRYGANKHSQATSPNDLQWEF